MNQVLGKVLATLSILVLSAVFAVGPITAGASIIEFDLTVKTNGVVVGGGSGSFDDRNLVDTLVIYDVDFLQRPGTYAGNLVAQAGTGFKFDYLVTQNRALVTFFFKKGEGYSGTWGPTTAASAGTWEMTKVPEPGSLALLGIVLVGFGLVQFRRKRA